MKANNGLMLTRWNFAKKDEVMFSAKRAHVAMFTISSYLVNAIFAIQGRKLCGGYLSFLS